MAHRGNWFEEEVLEATTGIRYYADPKDRSKQLLTKARVIEHTEQLPAREYKSVMSTCITNQLEHPNYKTLQDRVGPRQAQLESKLKQQVAEEFAKKQADDYTENRRVKYVSDAMENFSKAGFEPSLKVKDPTSIRIPTFNADCCTDSAITFYSESVKNGVTGHFPTTSVTTGNPFKRCSAFSADIVKEQTIRKAESNERPRPLATVREYSALQLMRQRLLEHVGKAAAAAAGGGAVPPGRCMRIIIDLLWGLAQGGGNESAPGLHIETLTNGFYSNLGFSITPQERNALLLAYDINSNNLISLTAFTEMVRGTLTSRAIELVDIVLASLASTESVYNEGFVSERAVMIGYKGENVDELLMALRVTDGQISADDFFEHYADVYGEMSSGAQFEALLRSTWGL